MNNITSFNSTRYNYPSFQGLNSSIQKNRHFSFEYLFRIIGNRFADKFESRENKIITQHIAQIIPEQKKSFLNKMNDIASFFSTHNPVEVNYEDKILEQIAQKKESTIFILTHSNQKKDPQMLALLNKMLADAYEAVGNTEAFQLPKIILNKDILTTMNPIKRKAFENFGAVGIDANISSKDSSFNAKAFFPVIKDFLRDKCNIFIFPEGRLAIYKSLPLEKRFQSGIAELINKLLNSKKQINVVPVGFGYGKVDSIQIGYPVVFKRNGDVTTVTKGSIPKSENPLSKFFEKFSKQTDIPITENGKPVEQNNLTAFIKGILCENLKVCASIASKKSEKEITGQSILEI